MNKSNTYIYVVLYLLAIVVANISIIIYGPNVTILNAFLLIGFNLIARDKLHELWQKNIKRNMAVLILFGAVLSYILGSPIIAIASAIAFIASETVDAIVYQFMIDKDKLAKQNISNLFAAIVDSFIFPAIAFGFPILWPIVIGQFVAKVLGGFIWSLLLRNK